MGAIETLRDALFGNPPSSTFKPSQEGVLAAFTQLDNDLRQLLALSGVANTIYPTTAAGITATTNGQLFLVQGSGNNFARLYKNVSGSAVDQNVSLPSSAFVDAVDAKVNTALAPDRPIIETGGFGQLILDTNGIYGGGAAVYAPILPQYLRASAMAFAGTLTPTNADAGGRMAGNTKLAITVGNDTLMRVGYNLDANQWFLLPATSSISFRYITVGLFVSGQSSVSPQNGARWSQPQHLTSKSIVLPRNILAVDGGQIWIPRSYVVPLGAAGYDEVSPSDGSQYFVQSVSMDDVVRRHLYDKSIKRGGGTNQAAVRTVDGVAAPLSDQADIAILATSVNGVVTAPEFQVVGDGGIAPVENQNPYALGFDADAMPRRYLNTVPTDISSMELRAMGITRGHWDPSSTNAAYVGLDFPTRPKIGQRFFSRFYLETTQAGSFGGVQQAYFFYNNGAAFVPEYATFLRQISTTVREYGVWHTVARDDYEGFWTGADASGQTVYRVKVAGLQYHCSDTPALWIRRNDYPRALNLAYPDTLFASAGRPLHFYPASVEKRRTDRAEALFTFSSLKTGGTSDVEFVSSGTSDIIIDPDKLGATGTITARPYAASDEVRNFLSLNILVGPKAATGIIRFHSLGDSVTNREQPMRVGKSLAARGYTVSTVGTMINNGGGTATARTWGGEGREGIEWADYIYEDMSYAVPLPVGQEAAYLAMTDEQKRGYNPYIRATQAGDNPAHVFNGFIFDFRFYLNRFGFADPTHALVQLGRNDVTLRDPAVSMAQMQRGFAVIFSQMRAACPTMQIGFVQGGEARSSGNSTDWSTDHWNMTCALMTLIEARRAIGDTRVWFVPAYAHMTPEVGWPLSSPLATDTDSNMITSKIDDYIHSIGVARQQLAEGRADFINATAGGTPINADAPTLYKGAWNASTNNPPLAAGVGNNGDTYEVSVAGSQSVTGAAVAYAIGDRVRFTTNGNKWERFPATSGGVTSFSISGGSTGYSFSVSNGGLGPVVVTMSGFQTIAGGGTGASNAAGARTNLEVPGLLTANTFIGPQTIQGNLLASSDGTSTNAVLVQFSGGAGYARSNAGPLFVGGEGSNTVRIGATSLSPTTSGTVTLGTGTTRWALGAFVDINMSGVFTSRLTIDQAGDAALWMKGNSFVGFQIDSARESSGDHALIVGRASRGTIAAPTALLALDVAMTFQGRLYDGVSSYRNGPAIRFVAAEDQTPTNVGSYVRIEAVANGSATPLEVVRFQPGVGWSAFGANVVVDANRGLRRRIYTFATLPAQPYPAGTEFEISDGPNTPPAWGAAAIGGGSTNRPIRSTGSSYIFG